MDSSSDQTQFTETELGEAPFEVHSRESVERRVCGNESGNKIHQAKEMMFGWRDSFDYVECAHCSVCPQFMLRTAFGRGFLATLEKHFNFMME